MRSTAKKQSLTIAQPISHTPQLRQLCFTPIQLTLWGVLGWLSWGRFFRHNIMIGTNAFVTSIAKKRQENVSRRCQRVGWAPSNRERVHFRDRVTTNEITEGQAFGKFVGAQRDGKIHAPIPQINLRWA